MFKKATGITVTAGPPPAWQEILNMPYTIYDGETIYEFKISLTVTYSNVNNSFFIRFSNDNGVNWTDFQSEPKDSSDKFAIYYAFPKSYLTAFSSTMILEAARTGTDTMTIDFADIMVQRVL